MIQPRAMGGDLLVTAHPASILRQADPVRASATYAALVADLRLARAQPAVVGVQSTTKLI